MRVPSPATIESDDDDNVWFPNLCLEQRDKMILEKKEWLNDKHIWAAQHLLQKQFPNIDGLQDVILVKAGKYLTFLSSELHIILFDVKLYAKSCKLKTMRESGFACLPSIVHNIHIVANHPGMAGTVPECYPLSQQCCHLKIATEVGFSATLLLFNVPNT